MIVKIKGGPGSACLSSITFEVGEKKRSGLARCYGCGQSARFPIFFMTAITTTFAPGRVEMLGNHTDYNEGYVLAAAIDRGVTARAQALEIPEIRLRSEGLWGEVTVPANLRTPLEGEVRWANYPLGVIRQFVERGAPFQGVSIDFESNMPIGAGLSSSAAIELSTAMALQKLLGTTFDRLELALLCQAAENRFVGVNCGLLDQATSAFGEADQLVSLDCREQSVTTFPFSERLRLLVANSGVSHSLVGGEYNERRSRCQEAAKLLGVPALRDVDPAMLEANRETLPELVYRRAKHVVGENARVLKARQAMEAGEPEKLGPLMFDSHQSSRVNFENSTRELDLLVEIARDIPGVLGSRLSGGGFGGAMVSLVQADAAQSASAAMAEAYQKRTGIRSEVLILRPGQGARLME